MRGYEPTGQEADGLAAQPASLRVLLGVVLILAGLLILGDVALAALFSRLFVGVVAIVAGTFEVVHVLWTRGRAGSTWQVALGILYVALGVVLAGQPLSDLRLTYVAGLLFLLSGILRLLVGYSRYKDAGWTMILSGAFGVAAGLFILSGFPRTTFWLLGLLLGFDIMSHGLAWLVHDWSPAAATPRAPADADQVNRKAGRNDRQ